LEIGLVATDGCFVEPTLFSTCEGFVEPCFGVQVFVEIADTRHRGSLSYLFVPSSSETDKLKALTKGVRALSPAFEIRLVPSKENPDHWAVFVEITNAVVIIETDFGLLDNVLGLAISKLANISQRTLAAVRPQPGDPEIK